MTFYDLPNGKYQAGHRGIDLPSTPGALVRAPTSGVVSFAGVVVDRPTLTIRTASGALLSIEPLVSEAKTGDTVTAGQIIGAVSVGGHCADQCLHLGVRVNDEYVNPLRYFRGKPVLVPW